MAEVIPFNGVLYNPEMIEDMADVTAPPFDVISVKDRNGLYQRHPNNVIRLILGRSRSEDQNQSDIHLRAAIFFRQWLDGNILRRDAESAYYLTRVTFRLDQEIISRLGLIGCVRLEPFEKGIVLPHERTFSKVRSERLGLMQACHANFSPIFGLYADDSTILARLEHAAQSRPPEMDLIDDMGSRHSLWRITDEQTRRQIQSALEDQRIYIADGHHRYETALNYRQWIRAHDDRFDSNHPANFVMMSLCSLKDPGMIILPAHRLLKDVSAAQMATLLPRAEAYFDIQSFSTRTGVESALTQLDEALARQVDGNAIGLCMQNHPALYVLVLKNGVMDDLFGEEMAAPLRALDVSVLTRLVMMELLEFDQARRDDASKIRYATKSRDAVAAVHDCAADMAFILNPTKIEQVQRVSQKGLIMPRKSTYFFPKVISGLVMNLLYRP